jgi:hypothetical protein
VSNVRPLLAHLDSMDKFTQRRQENDTSIFAQLDSMETVMQKHDPDHTRNPEENKRR